MFNNDWWYIMHNMSTVESFYAMILIILWWIRGHITVLNIKLVIYVVRRYNKVIN